MIRALRSNGGYLQSEKGIEALKQEIRAINDQFDQAIENIMDPYKSIREQRAMEANPLFAAGMRGFDRLKWDLRAASDKVAVLKAQGL